MSLLELFCSVDDFCLTLFNEPSNQFLLGRPRRGPKPKLSLSEIMTIIIYFHQSHYRDFKAFYQRHLSCYHRHDFPGLVSYQRFVELMPTALPGLLLYLNSRLGEVTGIAFIDSTPLPVCHNRRIYRHKVFTGLAARGKTSLGWFYGFKLHLIVNECGELLRVYLSPGNVDDRQPVPAMTETLWGKLVGDRGYLSQKLFEQLRVRGLQLITPIRKNMKNRLMPLADKLLARKRSIIETINDQLKNISHIAHTRHRSPTNFLVNLLAGLIAYTHQPTKPTLHFPRSDVNDALILI